MQHITHTGERIEGERVRIARENVANDWIELAHAIRQCDAYADHVTEAEKDASLAAMLADAERIRSGEANGFTFWQRINTELTGECVPLLR